jgi:hypothetical protein
VKCLVGKQLLLNLARGLDSVSLVSSTPTSQEADQLSSGAVMA